jgi:hypothetical protein
VLQAEARPRATCEQQTIMSLDNTSHRPRSDELVPSRHALRVGEIDVLVISDGVVNLYACNSNPWAVTAVGQTRTIAVVQSCPVPPQERTFTD